MLRKIQLLCYFLASTNAATPCQHRKFESTASVCLCNADHCDTIDSIEEIPSDQYLVYTSNLSGERFTKEVNRFLPPTNYPRAFLVNRNRTYQTINGFGGAFTDSTGINVNSLDNITRQHLIRSYFSNDGIEYSLGRVPIGGTDFSTRSYSYLDTSKPDLNLSCFALQKEDFDYKIPLINEAKKFNADKLRLFASAWTAPAWMKTNDAHGGNGSLRPEFWQLWVDYFVKFLNSYKDHGIDFWGLTTGNEPSLAFFTWLKKINTVAWWPWTQNKWIAKNLGPTIRKSHFADIKLIVHDDQRILLPEVYNIFSDQEAKDFIDGIGVHWYWDSVAPASWQSAMHDTFPSKFFLNTEACAGDRPWEQAVILGSWERGEKYAVDIIENLQHWSTGWVDWNMALDMTGGPTYVNNHVDSPIIVNEKAGEFYKQPMFYALGHYSKFLTRGSVRIDVPERQNGVLLVAFDRPDKATVIIAINSQANNVQIDLKDAKRGVISKIISAKSFNTIIYW